jgi:hypothetical protein
VKFSDLTPGVVIRTPPRVVTSKEIVEFASRYDAQWFHIDPARARRGRWKGLIASGWHTCAIADPEFLLHEYFHVVHQWNAGRMTRFGYLLESARRGYWRNGFEREAREFAVRNLARYQRRLSDARGQNRMRATEQPAP